MRPEGLFPSSWETGEELEQIVDEMDATLFRSAFNPIIAEAHDAELHIVHAYRVPADLQAASADLTENEYTKRLDTVRARAQEHIRSVLSGVALDSEPHPRGRSHRR